MPIRRHLPFLIALLLPLMLLRALLPEGYMAAAGEDGTLRVVMCSEGYMPATGTGDTDEQKQPASGSCPFAHSVATPPPAPFSFVALTVSDFAPVGSAPEPVHAVSIQRSQFSRGPPRFFL